LPYSDGELALNLFFATTATEVDTERKPILNSSLAPATPFSLGAGHVFPSRSLDPGLVYDMAAADYLNFLCAPGYNASAMETFNNEAPYRCPAARVSLHDLNYPSITVLGLPGGGLPTVRRRVKNVGGPGTYTAAVVQEPEGVQVVVTPTALVFKAAGEEEFEVSFVVRNHAAAADYAFGAIVWSDGVHRVRSPLVVKTQE
jgi:hypothetical protein